MTRTISIIFSILLILTPIALAQDDGYQDVVYLKNGSVIRGMITEQVPGKSVRIKTADGNVFVFSFEEIEKITKEKPQPVYNEIESYYFDFTVGYSINSYPETTQRSIDELRKQGDITRLPFAGGFSVYWPLRNNQTMVGPSIFFTSEEFSQQVSPGTSSGHFSFSVGQFGASLQHYFTSNIGDGLFGRVDLGLAFATIEETSGNTTTSATSNKSSCMNEAVVLVPNKEKYFPIQYYFLGTALDMMEIRVLAFSQDLVTVGLYHLAPVLLLLSNLFIEIFPVRTISLKDLKQEATLQRS